MATSLSFHPCASCFKTVLFGTPSGWPCLPLARSESGRTRRQSVVCDSGADRIRVAPGGRRPKRRGDKADGPESDQPVNPRGRRKADPPSPEEAEAARLEVLERLAASGEGQSGKKQGWRDAPQPSLTEQYEWPDYNMTEYKQEDFSDGYPDWAKTLEDHTHVDNELKKILGDSLGNPKLMQERLERRLQEKKEELYTDKTGSSIPMQVIFKDFNPFDYHLWIEFQEQPSEEDADLLAGVLRAWFMLGKLGGYNAMNTQVMDNQDLHKFETNERNLMGNLEYNRTQSASKLKALFHNMGDLEVQNKLAKVWCDMGTADALAMDILINALETFSEENVGIKQLTFGGQQRHWDGMMDEEDEGYIKITI